MRRRISRKFEQDYEEYLTNFEQAIRLSNKGRKDDAQNLANGTLSTLGSDLSDQISELIQYNKKGNGFGNRKAEEKI